MIQSFGTYFEEIFIGKVFGISGLPVANPFPSIENKDVILKRNVEYIRENAFKADVYLKKNADKYYYIKKIFNRLMHK